MVANTSPSTPILWCFAIFLEGFVLVRGIYARLLSAYPYFYFYIFSVFVCDASLFLYFIYGRNLDFYAKWYWISGSIILIISYGIILEVFRNVLAAYPGAERFARNTWLTLFFVILCFLILYPLLAPSHTSPASRIELRRDFETVQAIFLFGILAVVSYYRIPMGQNLKGISLGYALCLSISLMVIALRSYIGGSFNGAWAFLQPFAFDFSLIIWAISLWSYRPNPAPSACVRLESDYAAFATKMKSTVGAMRSHLSRAAR